MTGAFPLPSTAGVSVPGGDDVRLLAGGTAVNAGRVSGPLSCCSTVDLKHPVDMDPQTMPMITAKARQVERHAASNDPSCRPAALLTRSGKPADMRKDRTDTRGVNVPSV